MQTSPSPRWVTNDVLIKIHRSAICGTDMHIYNCGRLGAEDGTRAHGRRGTSIPARSSRWAARWRGFQTGDRVSGEGHITCGHCRNCRAGRRHLLPQPLGVGVNRPGAFAEYLTIPAANVFKFAAGHRRRDRLDPRPFGNATHTALAFNVVGEDVLITGAGPIGIMAVAIARHCGARHVVITDVNDYRLGLAAAMGASKTLNVSRDSLDDAMQELGMEKASTWASKCPQCRRSARDAAHHEPWRQHFHAGHTAGRNRDRLEQVISKAWSSRASMAARCSRPGTRCRACCRAA